MNVFERFFAVLIVVGAFAPAFAADIVWHDDLESARKAGEDKPVLLYFTDEVCGWCRKMETGTFADEKVEQAAEGFSFAKLDIDDHEELAARYRVRGVPNIVILDAKSRIIARQPGYQSAARFAKFLQRTLDDPEPVAEENDTLVDAWNLAADQPVPRELVEKTVQHLARPERAFRDELLAALARRPKDVQPVLLDLMSSDKLALRTAAFEALKKTTKAREPFEPFAAAETRERQLAAWRKKLDGKP